MSSSGDRVLVGGEVAAPHLHTWTGSNWDDVQLGAAGTGNCTVSLSRDGRAVAIAHGNLNFEGLSGSSVGGGSGSLSVGGTACTVGTNDDGRVLAVGYCTRGSNGEIAGVRRANTSTGGVYYHSPQGEIATIVIADENVTGPFTIAVSSRSTVDDIYVVVGAPTANGGLGAVFAFSSTNGGAFVQIGSKDLVGKILKSDALGANDALGTSVALAGDAAYTIIAVGSPGNNASAGRVYLLIVTNNATKNVEDSHLVGGLEGDHFGKSVALSDDGATLVVGAPQESTTGYGYVRVYRNSTGTSDEPVYAQLEDGSPAGINAGALFGSAVGISGDGNRIAVGAPGQELGEATAWEYATTTTTTTTTVTTTTTTTTTTTVIVAITITLDGDYGSMTDYERDTLKSAVQAYLQNKSVTVTNVTLATGSIVATATLDPSTTGDDLESLESAVRADIESGITVGDLPMLEVSTLGGNPPTKTSSGMSAAELGGIIGGSVGGVALIATAAYFLWPKSVSGDAVYPLLQNTQDRRGLEETAMV